MRDDLVMLALLDLDGTLVNRGAGFHCWARRFVEEEGLDAGALGLQKTARAVKERVRFSILAREHFGTGRGVDALWDDYREQMPLLTPAFPGVIDVLANLRAGLWVAPLNSWAVIVAVRGERASSRAPGSRWGASGSAGRTGFSNARSAPPRQTRPHLAGLGVVVV